MDTSEREPEVGGGLCGALTSVRVLDLSVGIGGAYCARLLRQAGADVRYTTEHVDRADHGREQVSAGTALHRHLRAGQARTTGAVLDLAASCDVVIESGQLAAAVLEQLRHERPELVVTSISAFGMSGPDAMRPHTGFTLQAYTGVLEQHGVAEREPVQVSEQLGEWVSGSYAAAATLAALRHAQRSGRGEHIDVSVAESLFVAMTAMMSVWFELGGERPPGPARSVPLPGIERARDGWLGFTTTNMQLFTAFLTMIGQPELATRSELASPFGRSRHRDLVQPAIDATIGARTVAENFASARERRIPVSPVHSPVDVLRSDHSTARRVYQRDEQGALHVRSPFVVDGVVPRVDVSQVAPTQRSSSRPASTDPAPARSPGPLDGVRVVDLSTWWAGACATSLLGALGADVVKIESPRRPDGARARPAVAADAPQSWEWSWIFAAANTNKSGVTLDLASPDGVELAWRLLDTADLVVENYAPGVLEKWGLGWEALHARNPRASLVRMPAFGSWGPWRDTRGFDPTISQACGLAWSNGYADGPPMAPRSICDPLSGVHAAIGALLALAQTERDGAGHLVESAMSDVMAVVSADAVLRFDDDGSEVSRPGNRHDTRAPQGVYRCAGADEWLAVSVPDDNAWQSLCAVVDRPDWAHDAALTTGRGRLAEHDRLDRDLASVTAQQDAATLAAALRQAGVPAERVESAEGAAVSGQFRRRCFVEQVDHPVTGRRALPGLPFRFASRAGGWLDRPAPCLGEHNDQILRDELGVRPEHLARLTEAGVIGREPVSP